MRIANAPARKNARRIKAKLLLEEQLEAMTLKKEKSEDDTKIAAKKIMELKTLINRIIHPDSALASRSKKYRTGGRRSMAWQ